MTPERLAEIKARLEAATPGPWKLNDSQLQVYVDESYSCMKYYALIADCDDNARYDRMPDEQYEENAKFIAHSLQDVEDLLDYVGTLERLLKNSDTRLTLTDPDEEVRGE